MKTIKNIGITLMLSYMLSLNKLKDQKHMKKIGAYLRKQKHKSYVEKVVTEMRGKVCSQAIMYGNVDRTTRDLFLKYNEYLKNLSKE
tara:strand:+ start:456 stop:716 length:261 start_codon:yes stop_codon:yes gene_type:complete